MLHEHMVHLGQCEVCTEQVMRQTPCGSSWREELEVWSTMWMSPTDSVLILMHDVFLALQCFNLASTARVVCGCSVASGAKCSTNSS